MNKRFKAAIVGGGASGLLCAVELLSENDALNGEDVIILERNDRVGKKLLATGNGQGNITNAKIEEKNYSGDARFIRAFIDNVQKTDLSEYFKKIGVYTAVKDGGKVYPVSMQANAVSDAIRAYLLYKKCVIATGERVIRVKRDGAFTIETERGERYFADNVVLATGGKAGRQFGTDGTAYGLATAFGHKLTPLYPSLVQLKTEKQKIKGLKGVKEYAKVCLFDGENFVKSATGDLLFTDYGISGNAVFQVSDKVSLLKAPVVRIEFVPDISEQDLAAILTEKSAKEFISKPELLSGIINKKLGQTLLFCGAKTPKEIAREVKDFRLTVTGTLGFDSAQVTKGGIRTDEITDGFESGIVKGLYLVGETLDVDGECGGYNLTFAFISGIVAAKNIKQSIKHGFLS